MVHLHEHEDSIDKQKSTGADAEIAQTQESTRDKLLKEATCVSNVQKDSWQNSLCSAPPSDFINTDSASKALHVENVQEKLNRIKEQLPVAESIEGGLTKDLKRAQKELNESGFIDWVTGTNENNRASIKDRIESLEKLQQRKELTSRVVGSAVSELQALEEKERSGQVNDFDKNRLLELDRSLDSVSYIDRKTIQEVQKRTELDLEHLEKVQQALKTTKQVADVTRDASIGLAAVVATAGSAAVLVEAGAIGAYLAAPAIGTLAGTTTAAISNTGRFAVDVIASDKPAYDAFAEAVDATVNDAGHAALAAFSTTTGMGVAGLLRTAAPLSTFAPTVASCLGGGTGAFTYSGLQSASDYATEKKNFELGHATLPEKEKAQLWQEYAQARGLDPKQIAKKVAIDTAVGTIVGPLSTTLLNPLPVETTIQRLGVNFLQYGTYTVSGLAMSELKAKALGVELSAEDRTSTIISSALAGTIGQVKQVPRSSSGTERNPGIELGTNEARILRERETVISNPAGTKSPSDSIDQSSVHIPPGSEGSKQSPAGKDAGTGRVNDGPAIKAEAAGVFGGGGAATGAGLKAEGRVVKPGDAGVFVTATVALKPEAAGAATGLRADGRVTGQVAAPSTGADTTPLFKGGPGTSPGLKTAAGADNSLHTPMVGTMNKDQKTDSLQRDIRLIINGLKMERLLNEKLFPRGNGNRPGSS